MNAPTKITAAKVDAATWGPRYRAALNTASERGVFMQLAAEMEPLGEPLWAAFYDLATTDEADFRAELLLEVEYEFARYAAEDAYDEAAYAYEVRTGRSCDDACSPFWDREAWIADRVRETV